MIAIGSTSPRTRPTTILSVALGCCCCALGFLTSGSDAFRPQQPPFLPAGYGYGRRPRPSPPTALRYTEKDDEWIGSEHTPSDSSAILAALEARRSELKSESREVRTRWVEARCQSSVRLAMDDWVRRLDLKKWPTAAVGSAKGSVRVVDLSTGTVVASTADGVHSPIGGNPNANSFLFGDFDGGGTLAVALKGDTVVSAGREGGARAWRLDSAKGELVDLGGLAGLGASVVTGLEIDDEYKLWVGAYDGTFDGSLYRYDLLEPTPLFEQSPLKIKLPSGLLSMSVSSETGLVACGTSQGTVELISMEGGKVIDSWDVNGGPSTHVRSCEIFQAGTSADAEEGSNENWCVVAGGGDGTLKMRWLKTDAASAAVDPADPFDSTKAPMVMPPHSGMVVCLSGCRQNGLLVSGSHDGTLRVWDFCDGDGDGDGEGGGSSASAEGGGSDFATEYDAGSTDEPAHTNVYPIVLYQLVGYKVWLSSICVDDKGLRIVTDGADNTVVVHDFSVPVAAEGASDKKPEQ